MRAGLLSDPRVIATINEKFVSTWIILDDIMKRVGPLDRDLASMLLYQHEYPLDFVFLSLIIAFSAKRMLGERPIESSDPLMNRRGARLVGETALVVQAIEHGSGRVRLGDSEWIARGPNVAAGERVRVSGSEGAVLLVEPLNLLSDESAQPAA